MALKAYLNQPATDLSWGSNQLVSQTPNTALDGNNKIDNNSITVYSQQLDEVEKELECDSADKKHVENKVD
jgi:hypothetical protein